VRLQTHQFQVGDVIVLQGWEKPLQATMSDLGLLPLADRALGLGKSTQGAVSLGVMAAALLLISFKVVTVAVGFFAAAVAVVVLKQISLKDAYESIEGPVIVLLAALIPVAQSLQATGVTDVIGRNMAAMAAEVPGGVAVGMMLGAAMLLTPFVNNAAAVLMLGPVAAVVAKALGYNSDPFLMAVALGCACDFLTPIGHQNNLLVMGPGGYRFGDFWRLGLPLSLLVLCLGTPLIIMAWPL
jgi:di/tricarboxylate transporter